MATYFITGANRGLGLEFAKQIASRSQGDKIIAAARNPEAAAELRKFATSVVQLDLGDSNSINSLSERIGNEPIDVLINNAGISGEAKSVANLGIVEMRRVFEVNAFAPMLVTRALLSNLRAGKRRTIFNVTSVLGSIARNDGGSTYTYRASKTALNQFTASLAHELRPEGFTCVVVHPGWVQTDMGGPKAPLTPPQSVAGMLSVLDGLSSAESGRYMDYQGEPLPW